MPRREPKNQGGRPSKRTPEVIIPRALALRDGSTMPSAARRAGVGIDRTRSRKSPSSPISSR